jgi:hypothetical protein
MDNLDWWCAYCKVHYHKALLKWTTQPLRFRPVCIVCGSEVKAVVYVP